MLPDRAIGGGRVVFSVKCWQLTLAMPTLCIFSASLPIGSGKTKKPSNLLIKLSKSCRSAAAYHSNKGSALQELGRLDEAIASFNTAILLKPDYAGACYNKGNALKAQGHHDDAMYWPTTPPSALSRTTPRPTPIKATPCKSWAALKTPLWLSTMPSASSRMPPTPTTIEVSPFYSLGRLDEAIMAYNNAIRLKPDDAEAHFNLGRALKDRGCLDEAVAAYNNVIRCKPDYAEAYSDLGVILRDLRRLV